MSRRGGASRGPPAPGPPARRPKDPAAPPPPARAPPPKTPPATVVAPGGGRPTPTLAHPAPLACMGAFFGAAESALECGRARIAKAEYEDAAKVLEQAARSGADKDLVLEARYWLAETYWQLGRAGPADPGFPPVRRTP